MDRLLDVRVLLSLLESMNIGVIFFDPESTVQYCNVAAQAMKGIQPDMIMGRKLYNCHEEHLHAEIENMLSIMKERRTPNWQRVKHCEPYLEHMISPVFDPQGEFLGIVMIILDVSGQRELTEKLQKSERELTALFKASHTISSSLNLNDVLFKILLLAGEVTNFSAGIIYLLDEDREQLVPMATMDCQLGDDNHEAINYNAPDNIIAFAVRSGEMVTLERGKAGFQQASCRPGTNVVLILPLKDQDKCLGVLVIESQDQNIFRLEAQELLNTFANHAAVAIKNAQLFTRTEKMAIMDGLTNLYNRQYFDQILSQAAAQCKRTGSDLTVMMIDVNDLKFINDYFGHLTGDYILKGAAQVLQRSVRESDTVCRYGGDEMVILLPNTSEAECQIIYKRILDNAAMWNQKDNKYSGVRLSLSIGWATARGREGLNDILSRADRAMYEDKRRYKSGTKEEGPVEHAK